MTTASKALLIAVLAAGGCGGAGQGAGEPLETARSNQKHDTGHKGEEMVAMTPELKLFHDALAPRWHAEHGPARMADTCAAIPEFRGDAESIAKALPPERTDPAAWAAKARALGDSVAALDAACKTKDAAQFEPAFAAVDERFHAMLGAGDEHHEEHGAKHEH
jgi:hypothetical protein